jgi:tRNA (guanine-N7-)-methyltransferase
MNDSSLRLERRERVCIDQDFNVTSSPPLEATTTEERKRHIRSFVLRQGRFTPAQQRAFEDHWAHFGLAPASAPPDYAQIFGRDAPLVLEIGFGNGEQLLHAGMHEPEKDFIGIEVHRPGVGRLMNALATHKVDNVRLYNHDAMDILRHALAPGALSEVRIYFPDPWPKKRQQKRRMIQPEFASLLASRLAAGGRLHLATDWADYAAHMLAVLDPSPDFHNTAGNGQSVPRPDWRIETHFEKRGLRLGHGVWDFIYTRSKN